MVVTDWPLMAMAPWPLLYNHDPELKYGCQFGRHRCKAPIHRQWMLHLNSNTVTDPTVPMSGLMQCHTSDLHLGEMHFRPQLGHWVSQLRSSMAFLVPSKKMPHNILIRPLPPPFTPFLNSLQTSYPTIWHYKVRILTASQTSTQKYNSTWTPSISRLNMNTQYQQTKHEHPV
jgi:hypothetical protein